MMSYDIDPDREYFLDASTQTEGFDYDVLWTPFVDRKRGTAGFRCQKIGTTEVVFLYLNPSSSGDGGLPDAFIYGGTEADPALDQPHHYYTPDF